MKQNLFSIFKYLIPIFALWIIELFMFPISYWGILIAFLVIFSIIYVPDLRKSLPGTSRVSKPTRLQFFILLIIFIFIILKVNLHCTQYGSFFNVVFLQEQHVEETNTASKNGLFPMYQKNHMVKLRMKFAFYYLGMLFIPFLISVIGNWMKSMAVFLYLVAGYLLLSQCHKYISYWESLGGERAWCVATFAYMNAIICISTLVLSEILRWIFGKKENVIIDTKQ